ncbi:13830_t:CDS:2 [Funneliformis caledonium]|uniref:13830_t:CDS:1 n=1 Tax=Funneliformis caledonium TaxID=1117310 RepID=A0A9N9GZA0_9GLOM|nr:13830_t:CDS:2 [Funneliformis caledonium]
MVIHSSRFGKLNWSFDKRAPVNKNGKGKTKPQQKNPQPKNAKQPTLPLKKPQNTPEKTNDKNATPPLKVPQDTPGKTNDKIPKNKPNPEEGKMPPTMIPEKAPLPLEQGKSQTLSNFTIIVIGAIVFGVFLVAFIVYRKRSNSRKGAVRLYDNDDESQMNEKPRITLGDYNDYNDYNIQGTTDYTQNYNDYYQTRNSYASSRESYSSSLGVAFPVPPRRISDNSVSTATPTSATFRDHNNFPKSYQKSSFQN